MYSVYLYAIMFYMFYMCVGGGCMKLVCFCVCIFFAFLLLKEARNRIQWRMNVPKGLDVQFIFFSTTRLLKETKNLLQLSNCR
jgi:hypothetical protein